MITILLFASLAFASLTVWLRDPVWLRDMIWPRSIFQIAVVTIAGVSFARTPRPVPWPVALSLALPVVGLIQLAMGATAYAHATIEQVLHWTSLAAVLWLAYAKVDAEKFRRLFLGFALVEAALCLTQLPRARQMVFWVFDSGFEEVAATFQSRNNFAQFVELALPVLLYMAWKDRKNLLWYAVGAGFLYSSVVMSASRAGTALCAAEIVAFAFFGGRRFLAFSGILLVAAAGFSAAAGYEVVMNRFLMKQPYEGRYEALVASTKMIQAKPGGYGLGAFPHVYPSHSVMDWGDQMMNHAHNDWAEFAVDGGWIFPLLVAAIFATAAPRVMRHPWALGIPVVLLHAWVDYPFPRAAVAGWLFALTGLLLAGANKTGPPWTAWLSRAFIPAALAVAWFAGRHMMAERAASVPDIESYKNAVQLAPSNANYLRLLAEAEPDRAKSARMLDEAIRLNPYDSLVLIGAGTAAELSGDVPRAEKLLLEAARVDTMYLPRWNLANFYLRRDDEEKFWLWARKAADIGSGDLSALFRLAARVEPDTEALARRLVPDRRHALREYLSYLLAINAPRGMASVSNRLIAVGDAKSDQDHAVTCVERMLMAGDGPGAESVWTTLRAQGWIAPESESPFSDSSGRGFDWTYFPNEQCLVDPGRTAVEISLTGRQQEGLMLAQRWFHAPGANVAFEITYRTSGIAPGSGVRLRAMDVKNVEILGLSEHLSSQDKSATARLEIKSPGLGRVQVIYERPSGFTRVKGSITLEKFRIIR